MVSGRPPHLRIAIGMSEAVEVETPDVEAGIVERVTPRSAVKTVRDGERRGECRAVDIKHGPARLRFALRCRQESQEQR